MPHDVALLYISMYSRPFRIQRYKSAILIPYLRTIYRKSPRNIAYNKTIITECPGRLRDENRIEINVQAFYANHGLLLRNFAVVQNSRIHLPYSDHSWMMHQ